MRRSTVWLIGLFGILAIWGAAVAYKAGPIERAVALKAAQELQRHGLDRRIEGFAIEVDGRNLTLVGTALSQADRAGALAVAAETPGVGRVRDRIAIAPPLKPFVFRVKRNADGSTTLDGAVPGPNVLDRVIELGRAVFGNELHVRLRVAPGAPEGDWFAAARLAIEAVALVERGEAVLSDTRLTLTGHAPSDAAVASVKGAFQRAIPRGFEGVANLATPLDETLQGGVIESAERCQALVDSVARTADVEIAFDGPTLYARQPLLFERFAAAMRRCAGFALEIGGHGPGTGEAEAARALSERWAQAAADALARAGADPARLRVVGYGNTQPIADAATDAGRLRNRRIAFRIVP